MASGSRRESRSVGPFGRAAENAMRLASGITTCHTFQTLANRIEVLEAIMNLPIIASGSASAKMAYQEELAEIENAINTYCKLGAPPEA